MCPAAGRDAVTEKPQRVFISDLGNVILFFDRSRTYRAIARAAAADVGDVQRAIETSGIRERYEQHADVFSSSTEFLETLRMVLADAGIGPVTDLDALKNAWCDLFWENKPVHRIIRHLKEEEHLPLVLLSDTNELHYEHFRTQYRAIHEMFDTEILSFRAGVSKEQDASAMLHLAVREASQLVPGITTNNILYVDDRQNFVEAATGMGVDAHVYRTDDDLIAWLSARGYAIPRHRL